MRALRRAILAIGLAALAAAIVRLRGRGGTPPTSPGWQELPAEPGGDVESAPTPGVD
jgi:hypothetical protein